MRWSVQAPGSAKNVVLRVPLLTQELALANLGLKLLTFAQFLKQESQKYFDFAPRHLTNW